jgi:hypothetical protein
MHKHTSTKAQIFAHLAETHSSGWRQEQQPRSRRNSQPILFQQNAQATSHTGNKCFTAHFGKEVAQTVAFLLPWVKVVL